MMNSPLQHPDRDPILIAADRESFNFIRQLKGACLFYQKTLEPEVISFCYQREVWVLYALIKNFTMAMQLARTVQLTGSRKILVILINR